MGDLYGSGPHWTKRSGWTVATECKRWGKQVLSAVPGRLGSALRCRAYGFQSCGEDVYIAERCWVEYPNKLSIGDHVGINRGCFVNAGGGVTIEDWVLVGPNVTIYSQNHDISRIDVPLALADDICKAVLIREGAWLAANSTVLAGATVGRGAVVAAGAVVVSDVPDFAVVGGVPARVLSYRNRSQETAEEGERA